MRLLPCLAATLISAFAHAGEITPACGGDAVPSVIRAVGEDGEVTLGSGRRLVLADVRLADRGGAAGIWLGSLAGAPAAVTEIGAPDRWNRVAARIATGGAAPVDLAELLLGEGWALVDPGERGALCRPDLLATEASARRRRLGWWAQRDHLLDAGDLPGLTAAAGRFVVVEGRVASVGERRSWTYINLGRDWSRSLTVSIPKRVWTSLAGRGISATSLARTKIRVRGIVEMRRGPGIELAVGELLERLEE